MSNKWETTRQLRRMRKVLGQVNAYAQQMESLDIKELQGKTSEFRDRISKGETLERILPEAYAAVREASKRVLGMFPYDTQVLGAIALHEGKIAEMKTGEGKTLVATMPLYLNALTGKLCVLVTTNSYLAERDGKQMQPLYNFLGLRESIGFSTNPNMHMTNQMKKQIYSSDIVYTTNSSLGFDYLFDNLGTSLGSKYLRPYHYVIIDEADSVLLDLSQSPLLVSGSPRVQSNLYYTSDFFVSMLREGIDYEVEDKKCWLTDEGINRAEIYFGIDELYDDTHHELIRHINLALTAHTTCKRNEKYIVENNAVVLLDQKTGRTMPATKMRNGMHQAVEMKEHVPVTDESRAMASITYQSLFKMFDKLSGMTGTADGDRDEFEQVYGLKSVIIPTHKPTIRKDYRDRYFTTQKAQIAAAMKEVFEVHARKQPLLIITSTIAMSQQISEILMRASIPHSVLNAFNAAKEAEIIAEAGQLNSVTVATAMAGRGTDIKLGKGVKELGGLAVIGIGRMANKREELQSRGRSGRQGDPGFSKYFVSLEDEVVQERGSKELKKYLIKDGEIHSPWLKFKIQQAQQLNEELGREARRTTVEYEMSMLKQRTYVYSLRDKILSTDQIDIEYYMNLERDIISDYLKENPVRTVEDATRFILDNITHELDQLPDQELVQNDAEFQDYLTQVARAELEKKQSLIPDKKALARYYRMATLKAVDSSWIEEADYITQLRQTIRGRKNAEQNITYEYHEEAFRAFQRMLKSIKCEMMRNILLGEILRTWSGEAKVFMP